MSDLSRSISKLTALIKVKTGDDGKMFGSVTSGTIADELKHQFDITLDKRKIHLEHPIRTLGDHDVELRLHAEVTTTLKVHVESANPLPPPAETERGREGRGERGPRTEKRGRRPEGRTEAPEKAEKPEKAAKAEPASKAAAKEHKPAKAAKAEKSEKPEKAQKSEKAK